MNNESSWDDPIVEEVRKRGVEYAARFGHDLDKMVFDLRRRQRERGKEVVSLGREETSGDLKKPEPVRRRAL
ncbi:MAG TPA: hypothetical protein VGG20_01055 [Thermoanaerobaculia bacterium]|jgi:hypothetical protein